MKICMLHPYNRSFSIISLIMHDHDVIFIPKFQNSFTLSSWVLISNLVFVATHLLWFSKFGLISLIMHDYDVIISHHHKKSACVTVLTISWTHYKKKLDQKILCWKFARGVLYTDTYPLHYRWKCTWNTEFSLPEQ